MLLVKLLGFGAALLLSMTLTRIMSLADFGIYSFAISVIALVSTVTKLGLPRFFMREASQWSQNNDERRVQEVWSWSNNFAVLSGLIGAPILAAVFWLSPGLNVLPVVIASTGLLVLVPLAELRSGALQGLGAVAQSQVSEAIIKPVLFVGLLWLVHLGTRDHITTQQALTVNLASASAALVFSAWLLRRRIILKYSPSLTRLHDRERLMSIAFLGLNTGMFVVNAHAGAIILGFTASAEAVGTYRIAMVGASFIGFGLQAVNLVLAPQIASSYTSGHLGSLGPSVRLAARLAVLLALLPACAILLYGDHILEFVFGEPYVEALTPLVILSFGTVASAFFGPVGTLLTMAGMERISVQLLSISVAVNIAVSILLAPWFGAAGVAIGACASLLVWNILFWITALRKLGINGCAIGRKRA